MKQGLILLLIGSFNILHIHDSFITNAFVNVLSYHTTNMLFVCHTEQNQKPCSKDIDFIKFQQNFTNINVWIQSFYHENHKLSATSTVSRDFSYLRMFEFNHLSYEKAHADTKQKYAGS